LLHAKALVRAPGPRHRRLSWRLRHARRAVRDPDALPDPQARAADRDAPVRPELLARDRELPGARALRGDRGRGPAVARVRRHASRSARAAPCRPRERERNDRPGICSLSNLREPRRGRVMAPPRESERALLLRVARQAMVEQGLEPDFPPAALAEAGALSDGAGRAGVDRDLRTLPWCSIDNDDSRDLDQLTVAETPVGGRTTIRVAVADVSTAVARGSALDRHARANTTSVYTPPRNFPMLPDRLSTDLTSLNPDVDRLAVVTEIAVCEDGVCGESTVYRALVHNHAKLAYHAVGAWLQGDGPLPAAVAAVPGLAENLKLQDGVAQRLKAHR